MVADILRATDEATLQEWYDRVRSGEATYQQIGDEVGLNPKAVKSRVRRYRHAKGLPGVGGHEQGTSFAPHEVDRQDLLEKLLKTLTATQGLMGQLDDRQPIVTVELKENTPIVIAFPTDTHIGGGGVDHKRMQADMELIRDTPGVYAIHLGDYVDNFSPKVIPSGMLEALVNPQLQWELAELYLSRYLTANKLIAAVQGNHDAFSAVAGLNPCHDMIRRLGVPYLGPGGRVWLKIGKQTYKIEARHDFPGKSALNTTNNQRRLAEMVYGADVVALGHLHYSDLQQPVKGGMSQCWVRSAGYKRVDPWSDAKGFVVPHLDQPMEQAGVVFWPDRHKTLPFRDFRDAIQHIKGLQAA